VHLLTLCCGAAALLLLVVPVDSRRLAETRSPPAQLSALTRRPTATTTASSSSSGGPTQYAGTPPDSASRRRSRSVRDCFADVFRCFAAETRRHQSSAFADGARGCVFTNCTVHCEHHYNVNAQRDQFTVTVRALRTRAVLEINDKPSKSE